MLDLGCGSGRLIGTFLDGGAQRVVGIDGSAALLARAEARIAGDERLRAAREAAASSSRSGTCDPSRVGIGSTWSSWPA